MQKNSHISVHTVFFLGLLLAFLALSPAILPYGFRLVTRGDYIEQQLPFIVETCRILKNGLNAYSFNTFLGAPAAGSYAFYTLGSPFIWPLVLLPKSCLPYGLAVMILLKFATCQVTSFLYFRKMTKQDSIALLGALLYTFSSFTVVNTQFYHFTEVIAFFPLLLLGFEQIMTGDDHPGCLALFCGLNTLTNYYFMFGSAILCGLYVIFRFFSSDWQGPNRIRRFIRAVFESGVGCALAGFLLIPALFFMLQITRTGGGGSLLELYSPSDILERIRVLLMPIESNVVHAYYGDASSWSSTAAWLPLFGFTGTSVFMFSKRDRWLRFLLIILLVFSFVPVLCGIFALETNTSYTRWWYGLTLLMALATILPLKSDRPFPTRSVSPYTVHFCICSAAVLFLTLPFLLPESMLNRQDNWITRILLNRRLGAYASTPFRILSVSLTLASGALFILSYRQNRLIPLLICTAAVCVVSCAGYITIGDRYLLSGGEEPGSGTYTLSEIAEPTLSALELEEPDNFKRIDYGKKLRNYGLLKGSSSLTAFQSLRSSTVGRFISTAGFGYDESTTVSPPDSQAAIRAFLSVSEYYLTDSNDHIPDGFIYSHDENGIPVYTNPNALPMGFLQTVCTGTHDQPMNSDTLGPTFLAAIAFDEPWLTQAKENLETLDVYNIPDWSESIRRLRQDSCDSFSISGNGFTAHIVSDRSGYVVFTIPYDKGFHASMDGNACPIIPCDLSFMSVYIEAGEHTISFEYHTRGLIPGIVLSLLSAMILLFYLWRVRVLRSNYRHKN